MMNNKERRMEEMKAAGIDTSKFFNVQIPKNVLECNVSVNIRINENGEVEVMTEGGVVKNEHEEIYKEIYKNGYVNHAKLHRRWVMAQMFKLMHDYNYDYKERKWNRVFTPEKYTINLDDRFDYKYQWKMLLDELNALYHMQKDNDIETLEERKQFFTKEVILDMLNDYRMKLIHVVDTAKSAKCKGRHYTHLPSCCSYINKKYIGNNIYNDEITTKIYYPINNLIFTTRVCIIDSFDNENINYKKAYDAIKYFVENMMVLPNYVKKSSAWKSAYKASGSYYTLMNMIKFHDVKVPFMIEYEDETYIVKSGDPAVKYLKMETVKWNKNGELYKLFGLLKSTIEYNNFNFYDRMEEIYKDK